jgi:hypothetical protein
MAATNHAIPIPKNTLTAFEPVTLPIEESAVLSCLAALTEANVSKSRKVRELKFQKYEVTYRVDSFPKQQK